MLIYPSIDRLLEKIDSKYSLVAVASKRAREMLEKPNSMTLENYSSAKNVGKALEEIDAETLKMIPAKGYED